MNEAWREIAATVVIIGLFLIAAEVAWQPLKRRHMDAPIPTDPAAQLGDLAGLTCGGCLYFAVFIPLALAACWLLEVAFDAL